MLLKNFRENVARFTVGMPQTDTIMKPPEGSRGVWHLCQQSWAVGCLGTAGSSPSLHWFVFLVQHLWRRAGGLLVLQIRCTVGVPARRRSFSWFLAFFPLQRGTRTPYGSGKPGWVGSVLNPMEMLQVGLCSGTCPGPAAPVCCSSCSPDSKELKSLAQNCRSLSWLLIGEEFLISECHVIEHNS